MLFLLALLNVLHTPLAGRILKQHRGSLHASVYITPMAGHPHAAGVINERVEVINWGTEPPSSSYRRSQRPVRRRNKPSTFSFGLGTLLTLSSYTAGALSLRNSHKLTESLRLVWYRRMGLSYSSTWKVKPIFETLLLKFIISSL